MGRTRARQHRKALVTALYTGDTQLHSMYNLNEMAPLHFRGSTSSRGGGRSDGRGSSTADPDLPGRPRAYPQIDGVSGSLGERTGPGATPEIRAGATKGEDVHTKHQGAPRKPEIPQYRHMDHQAPSTLRTGGQVRI